jgi:hypothetical protein
MHVAEIQQKLKQQPFEPFEIVMSSGDRYSVHHPENVLLTRTSVVVATEFQRKRDPLPEGFVILSYLHIAAIQPARRRKAS